MENNDDNNCNYCGAYNPDFTCGGHPACKTLYCSQYCSSADWIAQHALVCARHHDRRHTKRNAHWSCKKLHHKKWESAKQRRFFGAKCSKVGTKTSNGAVSDTFRDAVMKDLNQWENPTALRRGIKKLHLHFLPQVKEPIPLKLSHCDDWPMFREQVARQTTLRHQYYQIELCDDVLNKEWQATQSSSVVMHNPDQHTHVAIVLLHEFGHILDQEDALGPCKHTGEEDRASCFADRFLLYGSKALSHGDGV